MKKGFFYTHQGWTDIINCLPLINYYANLYDELNVMVREDSKDILDYYVKQFDNVKLNYLHKYVLDTNAILPTEEYDVLYHGIHDRLRKDEFRDKFNSTDIYFVKRFYECYNIPFESKVNSFGIKRDSELENRIYNEFIDKYGDDYILYHDDQNSPGGSTGINLDQYLSNYDNKINLNGITRNIFEYVKVLENAKEIHLVDSIWASICYLLDAKYQIFKNKSVKLYSFKSRSGGLIENYGNMVIEPYHPQNWSVMAI